MASQRDKFITPLERRKRIEKVMERRGGWKWHHLSQVMGKEMTSVVRTFRVTGNAHSNPSLDMLKACATALGVSVGFLVDRTLRRG